MMIRERQETEAAQDEWGGAKGPLSADEEVLGGEEEGGGRGGGAARRDHGAEPLEALQQSQVA